MEQKTNQEFPYVSGTQFKDENANKYPNSIPDIVKDELNLGLWLSWIGEQYYHSFEANKRIKKAYHFKGQTRREKDAQEKNDFIQHLQSKANSLRFASKFKIWLLSFVVIFGVSGEFLIYVSIAENAFGLLPPKSYFLGMLAVMFAKFVQVVSMKHIKMWIKENNVLLRSIQKTILFVLVGLVFLNAMTLGITNLNQINQSNAIARVEYLSSSISEAEGYGEDTSALESELSALQAELNGESPFITTVKFIAIGLIGLLTMACGAVLFCMADLYNDALKLKKKIQKQKDLLSKLRADFEYYLTTYDQLLSIQKEVIQLYAQKAFLEKLLSPKRTDELKVTTSETK